MGFTSIEVDDEVMAVLKKNAEPFQDKPNDVLRKLLLHSPKESFKFYPKTEVPEIAQGIPAALKQILQVVILVKKDGMSRRSATKLVADHLGIAHQTVSDKYVRQLGLDTVKHFEGMLEEENVATLKRLLKKLYTDPSLRNVIEKSLQGF